MGNSESTPRKPENDNNTNDNRKYDVQFPFTDSSSDSSDTNINQWNNDSEVDFSKTPASPNQNINNDLLLSTQQQPQIQRKNVALVQATTNQEINNISSNNQQLDSSPFISSNMYNEIMKDTNSSDSPFISKDEYDEIMKGGHKLSSDSSFENVKSVSVSSGYSPQSNNINNSSSSPQNDLVVSPKSSSLSEMKNKLSISSIMSGSESSLISPFDNLSSSSTQKVISDSASEYNIKMYGFSDTSSEVIKTSENNYINSSSPSSTTPYKVDSSSVNTSDIKLISVDDVSEQIGQRSL